MPVGTNLRRQLAATLPIEYTPQSAAGVSFETRQVLLGHTNGSIATHYSAAEIGELIDAVNRVAASRATPALTTLRVTGTQKVERNTLVTSKALQALQPKF